LTGESGQNPKLYCGCPTQGNIIQAVRVPSLERKFLSVIKGSLFRETLSN